MLQLKMKIEQEFAVQFNSCLVGKFNAPDNKIGFHSDASPNMGEDPYIASVSLSKSRNFVLIKQK
jgi:alkylated DNA repair dioxygenase AlkB